MKMPTIPRVPSVVAKALDETATRLDELKLDDIITAATWAFCRQDKAIRRIIVADFWFSGPTEFEMSKIKPRPKTFKEKIHALAAYCYAALRRRLAQ